MAGTWDSRQDLSVVGSLNIPQMKKFHPGLSIKIFLCRQQYGVILAVCTLRHSASHDD